MGTLPISRKWGVSHFPRPLPRRLPRDAFNLRAVNHTPQFGVIMLKPILATLGLAASALLPAHAGSTTQYRTNDDPSVVTEWNSIAEGVIPASAGVTLPRTYAMMHIAM